MSPDGSLSFCGKRKGRKERRQNQGFGILFAAEVSSTSVSSYLADRDVQNSHLASYDLCGAIRWPLTRARAALTQQGYTLRLPCYAQHFLSSFRRGRCLHRLLLYSLSPIGRGDHTLPPGIAPQLMKKPCHCESAPRPWRSVSPSAAVFMSPTAPFLSAAKEREERTPPKPRFWNPFRGWGVIRAGLLLPRGPGMCKICTLLSYGLCGAIRWPLTRARAALTQQGNTLRLPCYAQHFLSSFRRGRCLHRPALPRSLPP